MPSVLTARSNSCAAPAGWCGATAARPARRVGFAFTAAASTSLASFAKRVAVTASKACTPGEVMDSTATSMPSASICAIRPAPMSTRRECTIRAPGSSPRMELPIMRKPGSTNLLARTFFHSFAMFSVTKASSTAIRLSLGLSAMSSSR